MWLHFLSSMEYTTRLWSRFYGCVVDFDYSVCSNFFLVRKCVREMWWTQLENIYFFFFLPPHGFERKWPAWANSSNDFPCHVSEIRYLFMVIVPEWGIGNSEADSFGRGRPNCYDGNLCGEVGNGLQIYASPFPWLDHVESQGFIWIP